MTTPSFFSALTTEPARSSALVAEIFNPGTLHRIGRMMPVGLMSATHHFASINKINTKEAFRLHVLLTGQMASKPRLAQSVDNQPT